MRFSRQQIVVTGLIILAASPFVAIGVFVSFPLWASLVHFDGPHFSDILCLYAMLTGLFLAATGVLLITAALLRFDLYWKWMLALLRKQ